MPWPTPPDGARQKQRQGGGDCGWVKRREKMAPQTNAAKKTTFAPSTRDQFESSSGSHGGGEFLVTLMKYQKTVLHKDGNYRTKLPERRRRLPSPPGPGTRARLGNVCDAGGRSVACRSGPVKGQTTFDPTQARSFRASKPNVSPPKAVRSGIKLQKGTTCHS